MMPGPGLNRTATAPPQTEPCRIDRPFGQARAIAPDGATTQAWLQTGEACTFTTAASIRTVKETLTRSLRSVQPRRGIHRRLRPHDPGHHPDQNHPRRPAGTGKALKTGGGQHQFGTYRHPDGGTGK